MKLFDVYPLNNITITKALYGIKGKPKKQIDIKEASGMIKFLTGSCLSGFGIVLKEPSAI